MALIGARGIVFVICFLVTAGIIEYLIILHIHSGSLRVQFSDWDNPRIRDGFSKVGSVEVENLEAKFKKIKFIPHGQDEKDNWRSNLLKDWVGIESSLKKDNMNDTVVNIQPPPPPLPDRNLQENDDKVGAKNDREKAQRNAPNVNGFEEGKRGDKELAVQKRAIDKKVEDYDYEEYDVDEHGKQKGSKENKEVDLGHDEKSDELQHRSEKAAQALAVLKNFKKHVSNTLYQNKIMIEADNENKEGILGNSEKKENPVIKESVIGIFDEVPQNSPFYNGRAQVGEILVETNQNLHSRPLTPFEAAGNNIMFTLRTTKPFHDKRLPLLFETWMSKANHSNIFIVTDGEDKKWLKKCWDESKEYCMRGKITTFPGD